jgi:ferredoxin
VIQEQLWDAGLPIELRAAELVCATFEDAVDAPAWDRWPREIQRGLAVAAEACGTRQTQILAPPQPYFPSAPPGAFAISAELLRHIAAAAEGRPMLSRLVALPDAVVELPLGSRVGDEVVGPLTAQLPLLARPTLPLLRRAVDACIYCHRCTDLCPPAQLGAPIAPHRALRHVPSETEAAHCTRCGVCFYACPFELDPRAAYDATGVAFASPVRTVAPPPLRLPRARVRARVNFETPPVGPTPPIHEVFVPTFGAAPRVGLGRTVRRGESLTAGRPRAHASIGGTVEAILSDRIVIRA